jgi:hypothetical protein
MNTVNSEIQQSIKIPIPFRVIRKDDNFLVDEGFGTEMVEVIKIQDDLSCDCFISQVAPESECEHIRAVEQYLRQDQPKMLLTQAEADIYLSRIAIIDSELDSDCESATDQMEKIQLWLEGRKLKLEKNRAYYTFQLHTWMEANEHRSKQLVHGTLKLRNQPLQIEVIDEMKVLKDSRFKRIIPEKLAVDKKALRKHITDTGEIISGVDVNVIPPKFSYQLTPGVLK